MYRAHDRIEDEIEKEKGFDFVVTKRDHRTGLITSHDPYILRVIGDGNGKTRVMERPAGSGNLWNKKGEPIGRWDGKKPEGERFLKGEAHTAWTPPETKDQKLAREVVSKDTKIAELERELAAIKAEREKKDAPPKKN